MKYRMFMIAVILSVVFCWSTSGSIENPGIGNPVGSSTVPPSTFRNSLIKTPAPIDTSGNLVITGNVRRGRHFRGDVPYRSATSFGSSLGSSTLSSFLRDSAGSEDLQTHYNKYGNQPYYSPTETVTTMAPGRSEIFMPEREMAGARVQQNIRTGGAGVSGLEFQPKEQALFSQAAAAAHSGLQGPNTQYGPLAQSRLMLESKFPTSMSQSPRNTEQPTPAQLGIRQQSQTSAAELYKEQVQDIRDRTQFAEWPGSNSTTVPNLERQWEKNGSLKFQGQETNIDNLRPKFEMRTPSQYRDGDGKQTALNHQGISALEQSTPSMYSTSQKNRFLQNGLEDLTKSLDTTIQNRDAYKDVSTEPVAKREQASLGYQQYMPDSRQIPGRERVNSSGILNSYQPQGAGLGFNGEEPAPAAVWGLDRTDVGMQTGLEFTGISNYENSQKKSFPLDELNKLSQADISAEANRIMGRHKSLDSLSESKFNQHMRDAEEHLEAGSYYRAASSFSLASVYQPDNPLALAGRGHALFAAGEYVSSALFLSRALAVNPEYLQMKVDLVATLGDGNKLAGRMAGAQRFEQAAISAWLCLLPNGSNSPGETGDRRRL